MKKAISPMVATALLIGFTIAVGAILSIWFTTFTRTKTQQYQVLLTMDEMLEFTQTFLQ